MNRRLFLATVAGSAIAHALPKLPAPEAGLVTITEMYRNGFRYRFNDECIDIVKIPSPYLDSGVDWIVIEEQMTKREFRRRYPAARSAS